MVGAMVSTGKLAYVSLNFHNSVLARYNILSLGPLANQTYFTELIFKCSEISPRTNFSLHFHDRARFLMLLMVKDQRFRFKLSNSCVVLYRKIFHKSCWTLRDMNAVIKPRRLKYV